MILVWPRLHSEPLEHRPDIGRIARQEDAVAVHLVGALAAKVLGRIGEGIESERRARSERRLRNYSAKQARRGSPDRAGGRRPLPRTRRDQKEAMRAIPYAFGTLPIRFVGDVIAHGSQGLTGTLIVGSMDFAVSHLPSSKLKTGKRSPVFVCPLLERE